MSAKCPTCKRTVATYPQLNGINQPTGRLLLSTHTGNRWGRMCETYGIVVDDEFAVESTLDPATGTVINSLKKR